MTKGKILILYYEIMGYMLTGLEAFAKEYPGIELHVFELNHKKITTFSFTTDKFFHYRKTDFSGYDSFRQKCLDIKPELLVVSGRSDKHYLRLAKELAKKIYTVTIQDTQLNNTYNIKAQVLLSRILYRPYFHGFWGCGKYGCAFGYALGFKKKDIYNYAYTADTHFFSAHRKTYQPQQDKTILFVGRLVAQKNIISLTRAFLECNAKQNAKWKLVIVGDGPLKQQLPVDDNIIHHAFTDRATLVKIARDADVFCLPSIEEPWGVVVHEFASMGLALLLSDKCGSAHEFLINGYNGLMFDPEKEDDLTVKLNTIMLWDTAAFQRMGENSIHLSQRVSPEIWANTLYAMYLNGQNFIAQKN